MKLAATLALILIPTMAAAMQWDHFRRSTNLEDRTAFAVKRPLPSHVLWWQFDASQGTKLHYYATK